VVECWWKVVECWSKMAECWWRASGFSRAASSDNLNYGDPGWADFGWGDSGEAGSRMC
jgi:hypothetical protein